ncbi:type VI secretion system tip protein VgrG [Paraburkholderia sp. Ac-20340]|uniref:type VI secretion system Vgr family protein n=1 Tax=Paraburkholderia sp. Ac-20340 TaxID=2703888 RepID=UPI00197D57CB|nr:type VI secretion system Vgr family protein [Paraburkholderia sp. Ac-20340]MBN3854979.1 type VI secretion system tip protein VgrG [Paraburkholderia sp. Ac-20340]
MTTLQWQMLSMRGPALPERPTVNSRGRPHDESVLIPRRIVGREGIGKLFEYRVEATARASFLPMIFDEDERTRIDLDRIAGTPIWLTIDLERVEDSRDPTRIVTSSSGAGVREINGIVASARVLGRQGDDNIYEFVVRPVFWLASLKVNSRAFSGSIIDILHDVISPYGLIEWRIGELHHPQRDTIRQAWESDWVFFLRLCEEWGFVVWFEHRDKTHVLVIADHVGAYRRHERAYASLRYHAGGGHIDEEHIDAFTLSSTVTAGKITVQDHSYKTPRLSPNAIAFRETYAQPRNTANAAQEIFTRAEFAQPNNRRSAHYDETGWRDDARYLARVKLEALRATGLRAEARGALRGIEAGKTLTLTHYPYAAANREYLVTGCELDICATGTTSSTAREYVITNSFDLQPLDEPYRMPQITPRPVMGGYEYAVIVGPDNAEIFVDEMNRALVQFDWDRDGKFDGRSCIWVRLATSWHGNGMGTVAHARCGQQVLISYVNGDPDRPVVAAFMVDECNPVPWKMPVNHALTGIVSKSLGLGAQTNHLALDDTQDRMQAQLASDHAKSSLSLGYITRIDGNAGRQDARGEGFELRTDKHGAIRAALGLLLTTWGRTRASGKVAEMGETIGKLTAARDIHESAAREAQRHGAQDALSDQAEVTAAIKSANARLKGQSTNQRDAFPEFESPDIAIASADNLHFSAAGSTHIASENHTALTTGGHTSIATGQFLLASALGKIVLYARKAVTVITRGPMRFQSQDGNIDIIASRVLHLLSEQDEIRLTAKRIVLNGGGSEVAIDETGLFSRTRGAFLVRAASHATDAPQNVPFKTPITDIADAKVVEHFLLPDGGCGLSTAEQAYRIKLNDGTLIEGTSTAHGETSLVMSESMQIAEVQLLRVDGSVMALYRPILTRTTDTAFISPGSSET